MIIGRLPFDGGDEDEMFACILQRQPKFPKHVKPEAVSCIKSVSLSPLSSSYIPLLRPNYSGYWLCLYLQVQLLLIQSTPDLA